jgi:hypothetical protein
MIFKIPVWGKKVAIAYNKLAFVYPEGYPWPSFNGDEIVLTKPTAWGGYYYSYPSFRLDFREMESIESWKEDYVESYNFDEKYKPVFEEHILKNCTMWEVRITNNNTFYHLSYAVGLGEGLVELGINYNKEYPENIEIINEFLNSLKVIDSEN